MKILSPISRQALIESLALLGTEFHVERLPRKVLDMSLHDNPWFTPYYIERSLCGIKKWLTKDALAAFLAPYPLPFANPKRIAIIAAGNVPLVCFHDILCTLLAGHICLLKPSHQDQALIRHLREKWIEILPELAAYFLISEKITQADFLISTGSNNTARYMAAYFPHIPKIIRKNRYSVGVLREGLSEKDLQGLAEDILLYNGLGCRNVSNLLIFPEADLNSFFKILADYPKNLLNSLYLERVLYERCRLEQLGGKFEASSNILLKNSTSFSFASMGLILGVKIQKEEVKELLFRHKSEIQVVVGVDTEYGNAQNPSLKDFADDIDTLKLLLSLSSHQAKLFDDM